ncbi:uncharacterized protein FIBRA_03229 [Fibroporia radiculosa]|uniref:Man(5)GlcNAc(2)-PP-dolichol translocation protein RFT1 n=1 Tax=Fibroporia radiculosa TaxID=599839 RepID=J4I9H7_9APHY|nr:uncharacterized protein FIBRA_03229 [Fibroporia radiculosa]CCM01181.1 predicted protein [Fibroporia radiculosa]
MASTTTRPRTGLEKSTQPETELLLSKALSSFSSLVILQFVSRIFTFVLNQALVRLVSPQVFGTAAIQFELLLSTILFLSREGVRNALLRSSRTSPEKSRDDGERNGLANISTLPIIFGVPAAALITIIYVKNASSTTTSQSYFYSGAVVYALAACIELLSEPLYVRAQNDLRIDLRVKAEGCAVVMRTIVTFLSLVAGSADYALMAFALGQAAYGVTVFAIYLYAYQGSLYLWPQRFTTLVHGNKTSKYFDSALLNLSIAMTAQSFIKHFLTEGDKFLLSRFSPLADQGGYAVASNYGSMVARIVFQPIEETSRVFFSKTLSKQSNIEGLRAASSMLLSLLLLFTHILLVLVAFGPPYLAIAIVILLPSKYHHTSAPTILRTYVYYIPMMAFNGVLEAFFASTASSTDLRTQSRWLFMFSVGFIGAAVGLVKGLDFGDAGLIWANVANLFCRALYAWVFALRYFREKGSPELISWRQVVPPPSVLLVFGVSSIAMRWSEAKYLVSSRDVTAHLEHIGLGVGCLAACLIAW